MKVCLRKDKGGKGYEQIIVFYINNPSNNGKGLLLGCVAGIPIGMIGGLIVYLLINAKKDKKN